MLNSSANSEKTPLSFSPEPRNFQLMKTFLKIALLGLAHGLSDCVAGFMIGSLPHEGGWLGAGALVLLYNALAFGGQVPAGMLVDRLRNPRVVVLGSLTFVLAAMIIFPSNPFLAIVLAGIGGAFFHVAGGMLALLAFPNSTVGAGLFAAPGVMGLAMGGYLAWTGSESFGFGLLPWLMVAVGGVLVLIFFLKMDFDVPAQASKPEAFDWHDFMMLVLLMAIALRSAVWNLFQLIHTDAHELLILAGLAAMAGKILGGVLSDRLGWRRYGFWALLLATPLLAFGGTAPAFFLPGIMLLQSATPAAVLGMYRLMPKMPATAIGMCFGLAIAIGGIPIALQFDWPMIWTVALGLPLAGLGYFVTIRGQN